MFHKRSLLPSFKDIASFCFMHSLKILWLLSWVRSGRVFTPPLCMHAAQTGQCGVRVGRVWGAVAREGPGVGSQPGGQSVGPAGGTAWGGQGGLAAGAAGAVSCLCPSPPAGARRRRGAGRADHLRDRCAAPRVGSWTTLYTLLKKTVPSNNCSACLAAFFRGQVVPWGPAGQEGLGAVLELERGAPCCRSQLGASWARAEVWASQHTAVGDRLLDLSLWSLAAAWPGHPGL